MLIVGRRDEEGKLLILGGHQANLLRTKKGYYFIDGETLLSSEVGVKRYNELNNTELPLDYVSKWFQPWYEKQVVIVATVPSRSTPGEEYNVRRAPDGELICDPKCMGFTYRRDCWHVQAVREVVLGEG